MIKQAVIAIGGKGTRLKSITGEIPKPLFPINNKSTLERCCSELSNNGVEEVILTLGFKKEFFTAAIEFIKKKYKLRIKTFVEDIPLGECGGLWKIYSLLEDNFLFINGDLIFKVDLKRLFKFHFNIQSELTLVSHTSTHFEDSDLIVSSNGTLIDKLIYKNFSIKGARELNYAYLGNAGIACINKRIISQLEPPKSIQRSSLFNHLAFKYKETGKNIYTYITSEYIKDMGTEKRFEEVKKAISQNLLETKSYFLKQKGLFIDRDGTLIKCQEGEYITSKSSINFLEKNIHKISQIMKDYSLVSIITNQPQISMGNLSLCELDEINSIVIKRCMELGLKIDFVRFCPHHPHKGFKGEKTILKKYCFCRKPLPGMLKEMEFSYNIDLFQSLVIGDSFRDEELAINAKTKFINVKNL